MTPGVDFSPCSYACFRDGGAKLVAYSSVSMERGPGEQAPKTRGDGTCALISDPRATDIQCKAGIRRITSEFFTDFLHRSPTS